VVWSELRQNIDIALWPEIVSDKGSEEREFLNLPFLAKGHELFSGEGEGEFLGSFSITGILNIPKGKEKQCHGSATFFPKSPEEGRNASKGSEKLSS
jgi:hypothetical protein